MSNAVHLQRIVRYPSARSAYAIGMARGSRSWGMLGNVARAGIAGHGRLQMQRGLIRGVGRDDESVLTTPRQGRGAYLQMIQEDNS